MEKYTLETFLEAKKRQFTKEELSDFYDEQYPFPMNFSDILAQYDSGTFDPERISFDEEINTVNAITEKLMQLRDDFEGYRSHQIKLEYMRFTRSWMLRESINHAKTDKQQLKEKAIEKIEQSPIFKTVDGEVVPKVENNRFQLRGFNRKLFNFRDQNLKKRVEKRWDILVRQLEMRTAPERSCEFAFICRQRVFHLLPTIGASYLLQISTELDQVEAYLKEYEGQDFSKVPYKETTLDEYIRLSYNYWQYVTTDFNNLTDYLATFPEKIMVTIELGFSSKWRLCGKRIMSCMKLAGYKNCEYTGKFKPVFPKNFELLWPTEEKELFP